MQISFGWSLAACKLGFLHCMAASRMQFASGWRPTELNLHPDGSQLNEIGNCLAAD
jgi:hypothetical protein